MPAFIISNAALEVCVDSNLWKTRRMTRISVCLLGAVSAFILAGCAAPPELPARSAANPAGIDLTGNWLLRPPPGEARERPEHREETIQLPPATSRRRQYSTVRTRPGGGVKGPAVHVFIETGNALKITQTAHGLFVSYDRAVVDEFTFGENRLISLGPIEAQRVSGWEGAVFVVETMDKKGATLKETWALENGGAELVRETGIVAGNEQLFFNRQVYDRT